MSEAPLPPSGPRDSSGEDSSSSMPPPSGGYPPPPSAPGGYSPPAGGYAAPVGSSSGSGGSSQLSESDERMWAMLGHLGGIVLAIIAPLVVLLVQGDKSPFARRHAVEALNFQITLVVFIFICAVLFFLVIPLLLAVVAAIGGVILMIMAGLKANNGEEYRFPVSVRLVK